VATLTLPLPPQALDLLNSLDDKLAINDAVVDVVDVRKGQGKDGQESQDLLVRGRDGKQRTITLSDFGEFEMRRGQQMYGLFVGETAILLYNPRTNKHMLLGDLESSRKRGLLSKALDPLDIVGIVRGFATDPEVQGGGSRALRELKSNVDKMHAEKAQRQTASQGMVKMVMGAGLAAVIAFGAIYFGSGLLFGESQPAVSIGNPPPVPGTPLVQYLDVVQLTLEQARAGADPKGGPPVCELVGSVYNRMGRRIDKMSFTGRTREAVVAFAIEGIDKSSEKRGVVIGRHPGACLKSYKDRYELSEPECVLDGSAWKGCRDVIRILF
jgi:hypothetical protein